MKGELACKPIKGIKEETKWHVLQASIFHAISMWTSL
jgi:hypothetical protein